MSFLLTICARAEIIELRTKIAAKGGKPSAPDITDPGFRALVEENVKNSVIAVANDPAMLDVRIQISILLLHADDRTSTGRPTFLNLSYRKKTR
jgi:hypothetical protein